MPSRSHPHAHPRALRALLTAALVALAAPALATPVWPRIDSRHPAARTVAGMAAGELPLPVAFATDARSLASDYDPAFRLQAPAPSADLGPDPACLPPPARGSLREHAYDPPGIRAARPILAPSPGYDPSGDLATDHSRPISLRLRHTSRWYDARNATWLSEDPLGAIDSPNLYAYVGWQPQMARDPMGLSSVCDWYRANDQLLPPECSALFEAGPIGAPPLLALPSGSAAVEQIRSQGSIGFGPSSGAGLSPIVGDNPVSGLFWHVADSFVGGALSNKYADWQPLNDPETAADVKYFREKYGLAYKGINLLASVSGAKKVEIAVDALDLGLDIADRNFKGGAHSETKTPIGDDLDSHHMPAKSVSPLDPEMGPAIQMEKADHKLTSSWEPSLASMEYRENIKALLAEGKWREAMAAEVRDVRRVTGTKYNQAMRQMLEYARSLGLLKKK